MEDLEDVWTRLYYFLHTQGHSVLYSIKDRSLPHAIIYSTEQAKCYVKCYKRRIQYAYPFFLVA